MQRLQTIINNRNCALIAQGKSLYELERNILMLKNFNICWVGLGQFTTVEKYILKKAGLEFDIIFDCASVPDSKLKNYELNHRFPRLTSFLETSPKKLWITTHGIYRDAILSLKLNDFWAKFQNQVLLVDSLFPRDQISKYMEVPNSLTLACSALVAGSAKSIALFGCDGYNGDVAKGIESYYRPEEVKAERLAALGSLEDPGINRDTNLFQKRFRECYNRYCSLFNHCPEIYNCSEITIYDHIRKINYEELKQILSGETVKDKKDNQQWEIIF